MQRERVLSILLLAIVLSALASPFQRDLFVGDETKYGQVVREMCATGAFFLPTLNGTPFTHKPPLHFWAVDLLTYVLGVYSTWAFVLPSLLSFVLLLFLVARFGGRLAAFVCATSVLVWVSAQTARMDVAFTAFIVWGMFWMFRYFERDDVRALLLSAVCLAIATLIKGPMAIVIGLVLFAIECWRRRRVPRGNTLLALAALIVIPLLWVVPAMLLGGRAYAHDVIVKQTVGRAVASWVHQAPPWYYLLHAPGTLFPWFLLVVLAIVVASDDLAKFCVSWIAAVLIPYSLMSSKLDVYMMAMIPPASILVARLVELDPRPVLVRRLNLLMLALLAIAGIAGATIGARFVKGPDHDLAASASVRGLFIALALAAIVALIVLIVSARSRTVVSTIAVGLVPLAALLYAAVVLTPAANEMASTRPLIAALGRQHVPPPCIALYASPYLWARDMPRELENVRYVGPGDVGTPDVIVTSRAHAKEIEPALRGYRAVDAVRMIGKWFDVYRR